MAKPKKKSNRLAASAKFTTMDGNRCDIKGEWPPLTHFTAWMLLVVDPQTPGQQHAMLSLLAAMDIDIGGDMRAAIVEQFGVLGEGLLRDYDAVRPAKAVA
jgi:hypothetical protein